MMILLFFHLLSLCVLLYSYCGTNFQVASIQRRLNVVHVIGLLRKQAEDRER